MEVRAAAASNSAKDANERADNYMLAVVLFASALFFAGISTKLKTVRARSAILCRLHRLRWHRDLDSDAAGTPVT